MIIGSSCLAVGLSKAETPCLEDLHILHLQSLPLGPGCFCASQVLVSMFAGGDEQGLVLFSFLLYPCGLPFTPGGGCCG